jgi:ADP-dependent NAD(P)H-hydrate dehydratase / NAD(P)H-hydrate epimerase
MKVLSAAQMREVDRLTIELGIPGIVLMENSALRVVEFLLARFAPLAGRRVIVLCGKGNNGGDGLAIARQLYTRALTASLDVVLLADPAQLAGDAAANYRMLQACGCPVEREILPRMRAATLVVDALLGTGLTGPARGAMLEAIGEINTGFPLADIVSVDIPSGLPSDSGEPLGESVRAAATVTFTAPKIGQVLGPHCERVGELHIAPIGSPARLYEDDPSIWLSLIEPARFRHLFAPRPRGAHKGSFGHVLVVGGSKGKTGAAAMTGMATLRSGAGLVTVASAASAIPVIASHAAELMTEPLAETETGAISLRSFDYGRFAAIAENKDVLALGPGMGTHPDTAALVRRLFAEAPQPAVIDADGLNALAGAGWSAGAGLRVLTPHPGEMGRLAGISTAAVQAERLEVAREFARARGVVLVLKGQRTLIAFPDGRVWVNPTGTPAMATGGTGDILTGFIAGLLAQHRDEPEAAITAAVYLHGRAGELGAAELGEGPLIATDLLRFLPAAIQACAAHPNQI